MKKSLQQNNPMAKQFFILGRNPELSRQEIFSYLDARKIPFEEILFEENNLIIDSNYFISIEKLGGTLKLGEINFEGDENEFKIFLEKEELIPEDKFNYAVFGNSDPQMIKDKFKHEKRKAILKHGRKELKFQDNSKVSIPKADYSLFLHTNKNKIYFGQTTQNDNPHETEKRDMNKPVRREELAISPRLSKILINLSEAKENDNLLDPFCGIGSILIEAQLKNINVHGIDKDKDAIKGAEKNLKWLKENYKFNSKSTILNMDSRKAPNNNFDGIATETPLGKLIKKKPSDKEAKKMIQRFEMFIIPILTRLKQIKKPKTKIAITLPRIRKFSPNLRRITEETRLSVYAGPIEESRPKQFIGREIIVFI